MMESYVNQRKCTQEMSYNPGFVQRSQPQSLSRPTSPCDDKKPKVAKPTVKRVYPKLHKKLWLKKIPKCAENGFRRYPACINLLLFGTVFAVLCATTPFWAYVNSVDGYSIFGLWHTCRDKFCSSIHDNIIQGKSVPAVYHFIQGTYCIGTVMSFTGLGILTSNFYGKYIKMTVTTHQAACCVLGISVVQQFVSLYVFATYFDELNFLYYDGDEVDFHGSYYCGVFALILTFLAVLVVYFDKSMTTMKFSEYKKLLMSSVVVDDGPVGPSPFINPAKNVISWRSHSDLIHDATI